MPVLDAKALEIDPQGAAFLKSVLRPFPTTSGLAQGHSANRQIRFYAMRRSREFTTGTA